MRPHIIALFAGAVACTCVCPASAADAVKYREKVLWSFGEGTDGQTPYGSLLYQRLGYDFYLYGTTAAGGSYGGGTLFFFDLTAGVEELLYSFCGQDSCTDGSFPASGLIAKGYDLFGTTVKGGANSCGGEGCGTVFGFNRKYGTESVLHSFGDSGAQPFAGLIGAAKTPLYGTTKTGGAKNAGTVFAFSRQTGGMTVLYSFCSRKACRDGAQPYADLTRSSEELYGTTLAGGSNNMGTVFAINGTTETVLHSFAGGSDGAVPYGRLVQVGGKLYGTTSSGGTGGYGTVFAVDETTGAEAVLHSFMGGTDGASPYAGLIAVNGTLYGTTSAGGTAGKGTVFSIDPKTGSEMVLYSFCSQANCTDGASPWAGLVVDNSGALDGTTTAGGDYGYGTVFALTPKGAMVQNVTVTVAAGRCSCWRKRGSVKSRT